MFFIQSITHLIYYGCIKEFRQVQNTNHSTFFIMYENLKLAIFFHVKLNKTKDGTIIGDTSGYGMIASTDSDYGENVTVAGTLATKGDFDRRKKKR